MKNYNTPLTEKRSDIGTVTAAAAVLTGQSQKGWGARLSPFLGPTFIASVAYLDLIVLGTHGKSSLDAFWAGSITPKVVSQPHVPLLLVPVDATEEGL